MISSPNDDIDRRGRDNEIRVIDGHFLHFFAPEQQKRMTKHAVFVLDVSGSMEGRKIEQLKDAMFTIIDEMNEDDFFSIVIYSDEVHEWTHSDLDEVINSYSIKATDQNKKVAIQYANSLKTGGLTNINQALMDGIEVAEMSTQPEYFPRNINSMVIF